MQILDNKHEEGDEVFDGGITGLVNVTKLRKWLKDTKRKPLHAAFTRANCAELLQSHEFDHTMSARTDYLVANIAALGEPLILVRGKRRGNQASVFVVDGWHRLAILFLGHHGNPKKIVPFMAYYVTRKECNPFRVTGGVALLTDVRREPCQQPEQK